MGDTMPVPPTIEQLDLADTDALFNALAKRFDVSTIACYRTTGKKGEYLEYKKWIGHHHIALGLLARFAHDINATIIKGVHPETNY